MRVYVGHREDLRSHRRIGKDPDREHACSACYAVGGTTEYSNVSIDSLSRGRQDRGRCEAVTTAHPKLVRL